MATDRSNWPCPTRDRELRYGRLGGSIQSLLSDLLALHSTPGEMGIVHGVVGEVLNQP